jgi:hypothetical protein
VEKPNEFPKSNDFSPDIAKGRFELRTALELVAQGPNKFEEVRERFRNTYFYDSSPEREGADRVTAQNNRAGNVLSGMKAYALIDGGQGGSYDLSDLGRELVASRDDEEMYSRFAQAILREMGGLAIVEAVRRLQRRKAEVNQTTLHSELVSDGWELKNATTDHTRPLQWMRKAGVAESKYTINEQKLEQLVGSSGALVQEWRDLSPGQQKFLQVLRSHSYWEETQHSVHDVVEWTKEIHGADALPVKQMAAKIRKPLEANGWIILIGTDSKGRGGRSGYVRPTRKLLDADLELVATASSNALPSDVRRAIDRPLPDVFKDLDSRDKSVKGHALETLAAKISQALNLQNIELRKRSEHTGGAEVDLLARGLSGLHHSTWLFQCKNTKSKVGVDVLKEEFGNAHLLNAHVIVLLTTGSFTTEVERYAAKINDEHLQQVVLIDGGALDEYRRQGASSIQGFFAAQASNSLEKLIKAQSELKGDGYG